MKHLLSVIALGSAFAWFINPAQAAACLHSHQKHCLVPHHHTSAGIYREGYRLRPAPRYGDYGYPPYASGLFDFGPGAPGGLLNPEPRSVSDSPQQWMMNQTHDRPYANDLPY